MQEGVTELEYEGKKSKSTCTCIPRVFWEMVAFSSRDNKSWKSNKPMFKSEILSVLITLQCVNRGRLVKPSLMSFFFFAWWGYYDVMLNVPYKLIFWSLFSGRWALRGYGAKRRWIFDGEGWLLEMRFLGDSWSLALAWGLSASWITDMWRSPIPAMKDCIVSNQESNKFFLLQVVSIICSVAGMRKVAHTVDNFSDNSKGLSWAWVVTVSFDEFFWKYISYFLHEFSYIYLMYYFFIEVFPDSHFLTSVQNHFSS